MLSGLEYLFRHKVFTRVIYFVLCLEVYRLLIPATSYDSHRKLYVPSAPQWTTQLPETSLEEPRFSSEAPQPEPVNADLKNLIDIDLQELEEDSECNYQSYPLTNEGIRPKSFVRVMVSQGEIIEGFLRKWKANPLDVSGFRVQQLPAAILMNLTASMESLKVDLEKYEPKASDIPMYESSLSSAFFLTKDDFYEKLLEGKRANFTTTPDPPQNLKQEPFFSDLQWSRNQNRLSPLLADEFTRVTSHLKSWSSMFYVSEDCIFSEDSCDIPWVLAEASRYAPNPRAYLWVSRHILDTCWKMFRRPLGSQKQIDFVSGVLISSLAESGKLGATSQIAHSFYILFHLTGDARLRMYGSELINNPGGSDANFLFLYLLFSGKMDTIFVFNEWGHPF